MATRCRLARTRLARPRTRAMNQLDRNDLPSISVRRPVLVLVINLLIVLAGIAALLAVEIRELPDVVARVSGIQNLRSASEENSGRIYIEFRPGVDLDTAAADVREAVSRVSRQLPDRVEQVVVVKADDDADGISGRDLGRLQPF